MKAVIIGASGATGKSLVEQLLNNADYQEVVVLLRREVFTPHSKLKQFIVNFDQLDNYESYINGDLAISCLGTTLKDAGSKEAQWKIDHDYQLEFARLASKNQISSFALLSAVNADSKSSLFYNKLKGSLEDQVKLLKFEQLILIQPGGLIRPNTNRPSEKVVIKLLNFFNALGMFKSYTPLPVATVAKSIIVAVKSLGLGQHIVTLKNIIRLTK